jgi:hypothetical protein
MLGSSKLKAKPAPIKGLFEEVASHSVAAKTTVSST